MDVRRRNAGPFEFPTSPVLAGRTFCTTSSDRTRRHNFENTAGEAAPGTAVVGTVSCLDQRLDRGGLELRVGGREDDWGGGGRCAGDRRRAYPTR